jgi:hypothetical protein
MTVYRLYVSLRIGGASHLLVQRSELPPLQVPSPMILDEEV